MRAAGAEGRRAGDDVLRRLAEDLELRLADLADQIQFGAQLAIAEMRGDFFRRLDQRDEDLREDRSIEPTQLRDAAERLPIDDRERLAVDARNEIRRLRRISVEQTIANVLLEEAAALLDHDHVFAEL